MVGKYSLGFYASSVICLAGWVLLIPQFYCTTTTCPPPDYPEGGIYKPQKSEYEVGLRISYSCKDRLTMFGSDRRTCQSSGRWSGETPFCDSPTRVKNPIASSKANAKESFAIDGSPNTCFSTKNGTEEYLKVYLDRQAAIYAVRMYLPKGSHAFRIDVSLRYTPLPKDLHRQKDKSIMGLCDSYVAELAEGEWVEFTCKDNAVKADSIKVTVSSGTAKAVSLCEIEIYSKDDEWCEYPAENYIPNGQLEVSRNRAVLSCNEGFREKDGRRVYATCESNRWSRLLLQCIEILCDSPSYGNLTRSEGVWDIESKTSKLAIGTKSILKCRDGYSIAGRPTTVICQKSGNWTGTTATCKKDKPPKDFKIIGIAVGSVVILVIFILLGLTIFLIQKKKAREVVVIYKPGENNSYSTPPSIGGYSTGLSEAEYSQVYYEAIQNNQFDPKAPPPKPPNLVPKLDKGYSKPVDDRSTYANTPTMNRLPTDLAFGTLTKSSSLYSTMG